MRFAVAVGLGLTSVSTLVGAQPSTDGDIAELRRRVERLEREGAPVADHRHELEPSILTELDYRVYRAEVEGNTGFAIARFRPGLVLSPVPWLRAVGIAEFAGEYAVIHDAYLQFRPAEWAHLTLGYSKPPLFASFIYEPVHTLTFPDWSGLVTSFGVKRDVGADVHLSPREIPIETWVRIGNGTGSPLGNDNDRPAFYGLLDFVLGRAWNGASPDARAFGLRVGAGAFVEKTRDRDGVSGVTPLGFVYYRPIVVSGRRSVVEAHGVGYAGPLRLTVEGSSVREERSRDNDGNPTTPRVDLAKVRSTGVGAEVALVLLGKPRNVGRAPEGNEEADGSWRGGAIELGARYERLWLNRDTDDVDKGGSQLLAFAVKWWPVDSMATSLDYYQIRFDEPPIEDPIRLRSWGFIARTSFFWGLDRSPR